MIIFLTIVAFILIFGLLIFVHEFGHFFMAKRQGIKVEEFAFGYPPRIWSKKYKETLYSINAIPLGGYVRMLGEEDSSNNPRSFSQKSAGARIKVVIWGVLMNLITAWLLLTIWFIIVSLIPPQNYAVIAQVMPNTPAAESDLRAGDIVIGANGQKFNESEQVGEFTRSHPGEKIDLTIRRYGENITKQITLSQDKEAPLGIIQADAGELEVSTRWWLAPYYAILEMGAFVWATILFIGQLFASIFGAAPSVAGQVAGPVGIFGLLSQMVSIGWTYVLRFAAILSLIVGVFNILPFPALDGGKLIFLVYEGITKRKLVKTKVENIIHIVGFFFLIGLLILVTYHDITTRF